MKVIWMIFFFLCIISVVEVFSASSGLTYKSGSYMSPLVKHLGILLMGIFCMVITLNIKCKYFKILTPFMLIISFFTLIWVFIAGQSTNGAQRWVSLIGIQFQPSEIAKGTLVLATAQILSALQTDHGADKNAFKFILIVCAFIVPLIGLENLSTAALLCLVILLMMVIGRVPMRQLGKLLGVTLAFILAVFAGVMLLGTDRGNVNSNKKMTEQVEQGKKEEGMLAKVFHRADTWKSRIDKFTSSKEVTPAEVDLDTDAQVAHANIAIASSNVVGKGPGNSVERDFLSQAFSDFIYAIIIEELGVEGAVGVAVLYIMLLFRTGRIASRCENNFPALLAMGLALLLVTLVSKGGTSTMINCIYVGVILSVSRSAKKKGEPEQGKVKSVVNEVKLA